LELAAGEHGAAPHRTKILGRLHGPATRDPVEASAARTLRPHVAGSCTRTSADPGLHCQDPAGQALHGPSRGPVTQTESDWPGSGQHRQPGRTALRPSCWSRSSAHPGPATARPRGALVLHGLSRGPVTQTESDWPGSGQHRQPGQTALRPSRWSRSSAHPGPATARPRWALVLHGLSRGPVTQTESDWPGANHATGLHLTSPGGLDQPGQMRYPGKAVFDSVHRPRSSADPRPATARPGRTRAARTLPRAGAPD
jgi:hypothetical protein